MKTAYIFVITLLLVSCSPRPGVLPTIEEVNAKEKIFTKEEIDNKCIDDDGKFEEWVDKDGTSNTFCVFQEGWGCDPELYAYGKCGKEF